MQAKGGPSREEAFWASPDKFGDRPSWLSSAIVDAHPLQREGRVLSERCRASGLTPPPCGKTSVRTPEHPGWTQTGQLPRRRDTDRRSVPTASRKLFQAALVAIPHKIGAITLAPIYRGYFGSCLVVIFVSAEQITTYRTLSWYQLDFFRTKLSANGVRIWRKLPGVFETLHLFRRKPYRV
jgi:hypothetical protein